MPTTGHALDLDFDNPDYELVRVTPRVAGYKHHPTGSVIIHGMTEDFDIDHHIFDQIQAQLRDAGYVWVCDQGVILVGNMWVNYWVICRR